MKGLVLLVGGAKELSPTDAILEAVGDGRFVPRVKPKSPVFGAVMADLMSVRPGDRVYFFLRRGIYGSALVCGHPSHPEVGAWVDGDGHVGLHLRADGHFFLEPLDMDEALLRPGNQIADGLRTMGGKSFFQLDPDESSWLEQQFYRRSASSKNLDFPDGARSLQVGIRSRRLRPLSMSTPPMLRRAPQRAGQEFKSEAVLHAALLERMRDANFASPPVLANAQALISMHHEYPASPAKQSEYLDRIDVLRVFGARIPGARAVATFYDCWEMKKGPCAGEAFRRIVVQGMKYVDFITASRLTGDFSRVRMTVVARQLPAAKERRAVLKDLAVRRFLRGVRDNAINESWGELHCFEYHWNGTEIELRER